MNDAVPLLHVHHDGATTPFAASRSWSTSWFGGPRTYAQLGARFGPRPLHSIAVLSHVHAPMLEFTALPLVYGLAYDGCVLRYCYELDELRVESIEPDESSDDWPYPHYPPLLPYVPLEPLEARSEPWSTFRARFGSAAPAPLAPVVVVVPPPATIGHSLWGPEGDAEGVTLVFAASPRSRSVYAFNVCT